MHRFVASVTERSRRRIYRAAVIQCTENKNVKTIALEMPADSAVVVDRMDSGLRRLVTQLRVSLARASQAPMELSETERVVREAEALRAAFLRGDR
jgi:hypothetical protein